MKWVDKKIFNFFFSVPRKFIEFSGDPASPVENRLRFSTGDESFLPFACFSFSPSHIWLGKKILKTREWEGSLVPSDLRVFKIFFPSHIWLGEKEKHANQRERWISVENCSLGPRGMARTQGKFRWDRMQIFFFFPEFVLFPEKRSSIEAPGKILSGAPNVFLPSACFSPRFFPGIKDSVAKTCHEMAREKHLPDSRKERSKIALFSFLAGPDRRSGPARNENERSRICLIPRYFPRLLRSRRKSVLFLKEKGPGKKTNPRSFFRCPAKIP